MQRKYKCHTKENANEIQMEIQMENEPEAERLSELHIPLNGITGRPPEAGSLISNHVLKGIRRETRWMPKVLEIFDSTGTFLIATDIF